MEKTTAVLSSLGVVQALFLSVYLLFLKAGNRLANMFLAAVLIGLSIRIGKSVLNHFLILEPWHRNLGLSGLLIVGPGVLLYGKALSNRTWRPSRVELTHFAPAVLFVVFSGVIPNQSTVYSYISYSLVLLHWAVYLLLSEQLRRTQIQQHSGERVVQWYGYLIVGLAILWAYYLGVFIRIIPYYIGGAIIYSALVYTLTYLILHRQHFQSERYSSSRASSREAKVLLSQVLELFQNEQVYLDQKLNLTSLANKLNVNTRELSRAINEHRQQNFSEFVNQYRVAQAVALLSKLLIRERS